MVSLLTGSPRLPPLRGLWSPGFPLLKRSLFHLEGLLKHYEPRCSAALGAVGVPASLYATPWLLTLYGACLPGPWLARTMDAVAHRGLPAALAVALALVRASWPHLKRGGFEGCVGALSARGVRATLRAGLSPDELLARADSYPRLTAHLRSLDRDYDAAEDAGG